MDDILKVEDLKKHYFVEEMFSETQSIKALDGVSFSLKENETLAVVGESGCGKSTLAKVLMQLEDRTSGKIEFLGQSEADLSRKEYIKNMQMIFQDPYGSLNPRKKVKDIIAEPLVINSDLSKKEIQERVDALMERVGLRSEYKNRFPHMFSGGQRQRIGIARALTLKPKILICDEPVSALDISIQAQVLNLMVDLQDSEKLSYIFISHDLSVVKHISNRVMVMYFGKIVEMGSREQIFEDPKHPYTMALLASTPSIDFFDGEKKVVAGEMPSPMKPPKGCAFNSRCPHATDICREEPPELALVDGRWVACHIDFKR